MPPAIPLRPVDAAVASARTDSTVLPNWGVVRRAIHRLCRRSRTFNTIVAAMEMRLECEELLSLPQYMAICPTGQCNALCEFCSVTRNRTGIVKKQMPFDAIIRFTQPVARVIRMYGLEGNGEPTLYERFDELAAALLRNGSTGYLITNGDRLTPASIDALVARDLDAVNFSLNAATAATHRTVMKLRDFERVLGNIRHFVRVRGSATRPTVSISMVVTRDNVHEVTDFIRLGEELGVDRVLVRPLSEIATELGAVEDVRPLVPFESEIVDMLDGVTDYLHFAPPRTQVEITPANFRAVRPDVPGTILTPPGFERRLIPPRPAFWHQPLAGAAVQWTWNAVRIRGANVDGRILESTPIGVAPGTELLFRCRVVELDGALNIAIGPPGQLPIASAAAEPGKILAIPVDTGMNHSVAISINGKGSVNALLEFDRLRTPIATRSDRFLVPHSGRWEIASVAVRAEWKGSSVRVHGQTTAGPYLLKSYSACCVPGSRILISPQINVSLGTLGVGFLSADQQKWLATYRFGEGASGRMPVALDTGANDRVHIVVYGAATGDLDATIDWDGWLEPLPARRDASIRGESAGDRLERELVLGNVAAAEQASSRPTTADTMPFTGPLVRAADRVRRAIRGDVRYYCQKPWTDLHNFTVDGRMDVCCIATGESQARFGLGNLITQSFQEVWNGPRAREFRRLVNSDSPLPPCRRCPMAYAYQGALFNPAGAERRLKQVLGVVCGRLPFGSRLYDLSRSIASPVISHLLFRGFKR